VPLVFVPERRRLFLWNEEGPRVRGIFASVAAEPASSRLVVPPATGSEVRGTYLAHAAALAALAAVPARDVLTLPPSVASFVLASKLALDVVVREKIVPYVVAAPEGRVTEVRWGVALGAADDAAVAALARALPPAARAAGTGGGLADAEALLRAFLDASADALVRAAPRPSALAGARDGDAWEKRWARALYVQDATFSPQGFGERTVVQELERWTASARGARDRLRTCFRLELPTESEDAFVVRILVQAPDDPSLLVDAVDVWRGRGASLTKLGRAFRDAEEALLAGLAAAARVYPPLAGCLEEAEPRALRLEASDAWTFLSDAAPVLAESGFGVIVPSELTAGGQRRLRLRMRLGVEDDDVELAARTRSSKVAGKVEGAAGLGTEDVIAFRWQAAIGDDPLTPAELDALAAQKAPLVQHRGVWVAVDPREIEDIKRRVRGDAGRIRTTDALRIVLAGEATDGGAVVPALAEGALARVAERLREAADAQVVAPSGLVATLRPYQERGLGWLRTMASLGLGGCLADDMGLGKTVQVLAFLLDRTEREPNDRRPALLVAPTSVVGNWEREIARFAPSLGIVRHYGGARAKSPKALSAAVEEVPHPVVLTTYGIARRDVKTLSATAWSTVVLDEAQNAKNAASATANAVRALRASHRFALTGTPVENRLAELWSVLDFANPGMLGPLDAFTRDFAVPVERHGNEETAAKLRRIVGPFLLRRLKSDPNVIRDLPAKNEMDVVCTLTREQATLYKAVVDEEMRVIEKSEGIERRGRVLALITALKQICNHPAQYLGEQGPLSRRSGKLARVTDMLSEAVAAGDRALVFTQYREMGDRLVRHLADVLRVDVAFLHGGTSKGARDALVERFQSGTADAPSIFVLSLKAGGTGLNLTAASHVFHYDRWWNPAVEDQATDRAYRIGQKRSVQVHKLVCAGTVEDRVAALLTKKRDLASKVVGAGERWITELGDDELRELVTLSKDAVVSDEEGAAA